MQASFELALRISLPEFLLKKNTYKLSQKKQEAGIGFPNHVSLSCIRNQVIAESGPNTMTGDRPFYDFLEICLRNKTDMVIFEAARAITELSGVTSRELTPAVTVLQLFLSSSKPVLRFAAVRTLNKVSLILRGSESGSSSVEKGSLSASKLPLKAIQ